MRVDERRCGSVKKLLGWLLISSIDERLKQGTDV